MKNKIMIFIVGLLVGALIATGGFFIYSKSTNNVNSKEQMRFRGGNPPSMPNGENRPEKPSGENNTPKEMPSDNTQDNN